MALALTRSLPIYYGETVWHDRVVKAFGKVVNAEWRSSGLEPDNAFTAVVVARTAGILANDGDADKSRLLQRRHKPGVAGPPSAKTLRSIVSEALVPNAPGNLGVGNYPATATVAYWLVDALDHLSLGAPGAFWERIAEHFSKEFGQQLARVGAGHDVMMDPVEMAMGACLLARIQKISVSEDFPARSGVLGLIPSKEELDYAIRQLFVLQTQSGIWNKYFPLFHYPDVGGNYCFSFELLEAVIHEFGDDLAQDDRIFDGLTRAVDWCEKNRLSYRHGAQVYRGWNSGQQVTSMRVGMPESWATSVVHMFLYRLDSLLSKSIRENLLTKYAGRNPSRVGGDRREWDRIIDTEVTIRGNDLTVKRALEDEIARTANITVHPRTKLSGRRSALLFGPPGTSKTTLVRALSESVGWPYIEITPSRFLDKGPDSIFVSTTEIFDDLTDMYGVIVPLCQ